MREITSIGQQEAIQAIEVISSELMRRGKAAVIAVADAYGELVAFLRMDGASLASITIAQNKAFTAARTEGPSKAVGERVRDPETGHDIAYFGDPRFIGWGGGLPVMVDGVCVGAVAVSGLPEEEDIEVCQMAIDALGA